MENEKLLKFINGECNLSQQKEVLDWINDSQDNKSLFCQLKNLDTALLLDTHNKAQKNNLFSKRLLINISKIAAIILICFTLYNIGRINEEDKWVRNSAEQVTVI